MTVGQKQKELIFKNYVSDLRLAYYPLWAVCIILFNPSIKFIYHLHCGGRKKYGLKEVH